MSKRRFYAIALGTFAAAMAIGATLQWLLPFWLGFPASIFVGLVIGNALAQEFLRLLLPPDE